MTKYCSTWFQRFEILESSCKHEWERRGHMVTNTLHRHTLGAMLTLVPSRQISHIYPPDNPGSPT